MRMSLIIDPYEYHMGLCNESCSSGRPAECPSCVSKTLTLDVTSKLFIHFFHTCHAKRRIGFYHFILLSLTLTLPGAQSKTFWLHFLAHFVWSGGSSMWWWNKSSWTSWDFAWVRFIGTREMTAVSHTWLYKKKPNKTPKQTKPKKKQKQKQKNKTTL